MENKPTQEAEKRWLLLQLWGLDTPITALCWSVACAALMQITMITAGPLLLVSVSVWFAVIFFRLSDALKNGQAWQGDFYRSNLAPLVLLLFGVGMATVWMLFFRVGRNVLDYAWLPLLLLLAGRALRRIRLQSVGLLMQSTAFAMFCALPSFYFSFSLSPLHMLTTGPVWYLGILFFLTARERERLRAGRAASQEAVVSTITLLMLLTATLISSVTSPMFERTLCVTVAIGSGCLQGFSRISHLLPHHVALALSWLTMALPAALGIILYAPRSW